MKRAGPVSKHQNGLSAQKRLIDPRLIKAAGTAVVAVGAFTGGFFHLPSVYASTISATASDAAGQDSFDTGLHWSDGNAPSSANDYVVDNGFQIRTIANGTTQTFLGNSLTLGDSTGDGALTYKGNAGGTITIANLTLNAGVIQSGGNSAGTANPWTLTGPTSNNTINVLATGANGGGFDIDNGGQAARTVTIAANLVGAGPLRPITFGGNTTPNSINGGTAFLTGSNSGWTGTETITGGVLQVGVGGTAGTLGTGAITDDSNLVFDLTNSTAYSQNVSVDSGLTNGAQIGNIATGTVGFSGPVTANSALTLNNSTGALSFSGGIAIATGNLTVANGGGSVAIGGVSGAGALVINGTGTTVLSGANTYSGNTTVNGGTLAVTGGTAHVSPLNSPVYTVAANATLDLSGALGTLTTTSSQTITGSGTIIGNAGGVVSGGTLAPGNGATVGTLEFNNGLTLSGGGTLAMTLSGNNVTPGGANNDLVEVTGPLNLTGVTSLNLSFINGTPTVGTEYEILTYSGALTGGTGNFKSLNRTIQINTATPDVVYAVVTAGGAANLTWNSTSSQTWDIDTTANWHNPALNGGAGGTDFFFQGDNVTFDDSVAGVQRNINVTTQLSPGSVTINTSSASSQFSFSGSGSIATGGAVALNGPGTAVFSNTNSISGTMTIGTTANSGGTLQIGNGGTTGSTGSGNIVNNGTIVLDNTSTPTIANNISGTGGGLIVNSSATLSGTNTFIGPVSINSGTVFPASASAFGDPSNTVTVHSGAEIYATAGLTYSAQTLDLDGQGSTTASLRGGGGKVSNFTGPVNIESVTTVSVDGGANLELTNATNALSIDGNTLFALGTGTLSLGGNTTPGTLNAQAGQGIIASNIAIGLVPAANSTIDISAPISDYTSPASVVQNGPGNTRLDIDNYYSGATTINNGILEPMTANAIPYTTAGLLANGSAGAPSTINIAGSGSATATINGALGLTGGLTINNPITLGGRQGTFVTSAEIENLAGSNNVASAMTGATGGNNYTIQSDAGLLTVSGTFAIGGGATGARILNLQGAGNGNFTGLITNGTGSAALVKNGTGTWTLSSANTYSGGTTVTAGTLEIAKINSTTSALPAGPITISGGVLQLAANATLGSQSTPTPASNINISALNMTGGQLDLTNNHIILNYGAGPDPIASIAALVASGYAGGSWNGSGIISSSAAGNPSYGIGYADSADAGNPAGLASGEIEIAYTLLGDANLDGKVNGTDFAILASNFNQGISGWDQGDFNYDGKDNGTDFAFLASNFNQGASQSAATNADYAALIAFADAHGLQADVPEPAALGIISMTMVGALGRRRRR